MVLIAGVLLLPVMRCRVLLSVAVLRVPRLLVALLFVALLRVAVLLVALLRVHVFSVAVLGMAVLRVALLSVAVLCLAVCLLRCRLPPRANAAFQGPPLESPHRAGATRSVNTKSSGRAACVRVQ